ncbi:PAS domain-containing protein [Falsiroseomonas selenitidurans]|uniref:histidine kinase n=1 Tax=Falsiroseomonas selenitidurans TaxID=2716335 RepID=A0ABX1ED00_9PROT|nr:PAS domain-containing protein [Falsiroseomonas selenitidurans]NKC33777.1 PAS domain-containing protein [Falsiroseomonas selenitidurans]
MSAAPPPKRRFGAMQAGLLAAVLAPLLVFGLSAWRGWEQAWRGAETEVARTADAAGEYARRLLEAQVLRLERANEILAGLSDAEIRASETALHAALRGVAAEREPADRAGFYIFVFDRLGQPLVASNVLPVPPPDDVLAARSFNQALRDPDAPWLHVSQIYTGQATRRPFFAVTARRSRTGNGLPEGAYDGILNASVYLDHVNEALAALAASPGDVVSLLRADGALLARSGGFGDQVPDGLRLQPGLLASAMARQATRGVLVGTSTIDQVRRVAAFRAIGGGLPVYAVAGRDEAAIALAWRRAILPQAVLALGSSALLLLLARAVLRRQAALEVANAALERRVEERTRDLRGRERLLRLALQAAEAASWSWEVGASRLFWSDEMFHLLGLDPQADAGLAEFDRFLEVVHPEDRDRLRKAAAQGIAEGSMAVEFRVFRRMPDGRREPVWLLCRARLYPGDGGNPATLVGIDIDITQRRRAEERFEVATAAMSGFVYEWDVETGRITRTTGAEALLGENPGTEAGEWLARLHPEDRPRLEAEAQRLAREPARDSFALEYRARRADGGWAWLWDRGHVTRDPATGAVVRMVGGAVDVTARRQSEERQFLLLREVDHRAKNALAVVKAALRLTPRDDAEEFAAAVEGRIDALARAQALLSETSWRGTPLRDILTGALEPFIGGPPGMLAPRVRLEGPPVVLAATAIQPTAMAVHELATNATKYGALSSAEGQLWVAWRQEGGWLHLTWTESGGPPAPAPPARRGFGSRVVDTTVRSQLGGQVAWHWAADGLAVELALPAARVLVRAQPALGGNETVIRS